MHQIDTTPSQPVGEAPHRDATLTDAIRQYGDLLYSACDNVHGFETYLSSAGSVAREQFYEGLDAELFQDDNAWYSYRQYCRLMSNVVRYQTQLHTHHEYAAIGEHALRTRRSFWYRYLALLPLETVLREATRISNRLQNAYKIQVQRLAAGQIQITIHDSEAFSRISFGSECRYLMGIMSGLLRTNGISRYEIDHTVCGKSLRQLILRQYAMEGWEVGVSDDGLFLNGRLLAVPLAREELYRLRPDLPPLAVATPALRIVDDFAWKGSTIFRKGDVYDAPCCLISVSYQPLKPWQRLARFLVARERPKSGGVQELGRQIQFAREKLIEAQEALQDSQRKSSILRVYVRPSLVELIDKGSNPLNLKPAEVDFAILFNDIVGFTALSEKLSPQQVVDLLNEHFDGVCSAIYEHGGEVDKIMGDCVLGLFRDPDQALAAALETERARERNQERLLRRFGLRLRSGTGIHYGRVILGNVGNPRKLDFTIIGDPVNAASRIQRLTRKYGTWLLCSNDLKEALARPVELVKACDEILLGRTTPTALWTVAPRSDA
jgi:class 3 adenylate cyclase